MIARPQTILMLLMALFHTICGQHPISTSLRGGNNDQRVLVDDGCECKYKWRTGGAFFTESGGCHISKAAPKGKACFCYYDGYWTCYGTEMDCKDPNHEKCKNPDTGYDSCNQARDRGPIGNHCPGGCKDAKDRDCSGYF